MKKANDCWKSCVGKLKFSEKVFDRKFAKVYHFRKLAINCFFKIFVWFLQIFYCSAKKVTIEIHNSVKLKIFSFFNSQFHVNKPKLQNRVNTYWEHKRRKLKRKRNRNLWSYKASVYLQYCFTRFQYFKSLSSTHLIIFC